MLRILIAEATRRNWTLVRLAKALDLTYERLAQYRRADADIANATRPTLEAAAVLIGIPLTGVYVLAGKIRPEDFAWPRRDSLRKRLQHDLAQLTLDPLYAAFAGDELMQADTKVQYLVALLYREVSDASARASRLPELLRTLQLASLANSSAEALLAQHRKEDEAEPGAF